MDLFFEKMKSLLGDEMDDFLKFYNDDNFRGLRVNTLKCSVEKLKSLLDFDLVPTPFCKEGFYLPKDVASIGNSPLHHCGAFYVQEPSATSAVTMLNVQKGDKVLDLCAAPGGKSTQIASALNNTGLLWANEFVKNRSLILLSNIERMGVSKAVVSNCHPDVLCNKLYGYFDKVLVDAPCSGEGMFRKHNSAQIHWSQENVESCATRQLQILNSAKNALKENGELVYSTCTFSVEENEGVIEKFLSENPDFVIVDSNVDFGRPALKYGRRIFPMDGGEGHFAIKLKRTSENGTCREFNNKTSKIPKEVTEFYDSVFSQRIYGNNIQMIGDKVYVYPEMLPDLSGLSVVRAGVLLGEMKRNRFEPHHSAFTCGKVEDFKNCVNLSLNSQDVKKYLHGEEISVDANLKGFLPVAIENMTVGFGKATNGVLKNKYPKGLRLL